LPSVNKSAIVALFLSKGTFTMKPETHPEYKACKVTCSCGNTFETRSTLARDLEIEVCSDCHPFYTGKQRTTDKGGRVQQFNDRFKRART
jgi:large subunit ribosomal protein L31